MYGYTRLKRRGRRAPLMAAALLLAALVLAGCGMAGGGGSGDGADQPEALTVYSGRKEQLIQPVLDLFTERTGIPVVVRTGGASELANAVLEEQSRPQADIIIANDAGTLEKLRAEGVLVPYSGEGLSDVHRAFRAEDGAWVGFSARTRVIMYNTDMLSPEEAPQSVLELAEPEWRGRVALAQSSNESLIAQITAIRLVLGDEAAASWMKGVMANDPVFFSGHTGIRQAVGKGEFPVGLVNHYYYHLEREEGSPVGVVYPDQMEGEMGTVVNVAGGAIVSGGPNPEAARRFMEFMLGGEAQDLFARLNFEIPVLEAASASRGDGVPGLDDFRWAPINLEDLGRELDATLDLIEEIGF